MSTWGLCQCVGEKPTRNTWHLMLVGDLYGHCAVHFALAPVPIAICAAAGDLEAAETRRSLTRDMWRGRLRGVQRNVEVWQALLSVRSLVLPMQVGRVSAGFPGLRRPQWAHAAQIPTGSSLGSYSSA